MSWNLSIFIIFSKVVPEAVLETIINVVEVEIVQTITTTQINSHAILTSLTTNSSPSRQAILSLSNSPVSRRPQLRPLAA